MGRLIELIVAVAVFWFVEFFLVPMLPSPISTVVSVIVVICAIVYLLGMISGYEFPWKR